MSASKCDPPRVVEVDQKPKEMFCGHCGCEATPQKECHCGAVNTWLCDPWRGWIVTYTRPTFVIRESKT